MSKLTKENKNIISLFPHNQELFDEIMRLINSGKRSIFYSQATGLGKSFIFMKLVHEVFKGKKILYIVPKIAIWKNMNEYEEFELIKDYVDMATYADFNSIKEHHYTYDVIFIDECHHLASNIRGNNILDVCFDYMAYGKYVFGFTATPKVGDIDVADYFESKIYGMDIIEAMEYGMFNKIQYAIADTHTVVNDEEYCKKYSINGTKTILRNILDEHNDIIRWLVYFSKIEDLNNNLPSIKRLFPDFKVFIMHSDNTDNDKQFKEFNSYKDKAMLVTVSMVLEGVHPKNVGGVILYRNVYSHNVLLQILGRICKIYDDMQPLCVDITNSIYDTKSLPVFKYRTSNNTRVYHMKPIIDMKASSYRYIELVETMINKIDGVREYRGIKWRNNCELCRKLCKSNNYVHNLLHKGYTYEQIIDRALDTHYEKRMYRGIEWYTDTELGRKINKSHAYVHNMRRSGHTYEYIIDRFFGGKEHRGIKWRNTRELARALNVLPDRLYKLHKKGLSYEEIIDYILDGEK